jgi:hypothetical protein
MAGPVIFECPICGGPLPASALCPVCDARNVSAPKPAPDDLQIPDGGSTPARTG